MEKKFSLFSILAILIIPVILYFAYSSFISNKAGNEAISASSKPVVLDFSSKLCMECQELKKVMDPLIPKYQDKIQFQQISVNSNDPSVQNQVKKYGVNVVPTLVFINKNGKVVRKMEGAPTKAQLQNELNKLSNG